MIILDYTNIVDTSLAASPAWGAMILTLCEKKKHHESSGEELGLAVRGGGHRHQNFIFFAFHMLVKTAVNEVNGWIPGTSWFPRQVCRRQRFLLISPLFKKYLRSGRILSYTIIDDNVVSISSSSWLIVFHWHRFWFGFAVQNRSCSSLFVSLRYVCLL